MSKANQSCKERLVVGDYQGWRYDELPAGMEELLPGWLAARRVDEGIDLQEDVPTRGGTVFGWQDWCIKFGGPYHKLIDRVRSGAAIRVAELRLPVRVPRPLLAIERRDKAGIEADILVNEWVRGRFFHDLWGDDAVAVEAFPEFMAAMVREGVFHGDFHVTNFMWDGSEWVLLDLGALRHRLRKLRRRFLVIDLWARVWFGLQQPPEMRALVERFTELLPGSDVQELWPAIETRTARLREKYPARVKNPS